MCYNGEERLHYYLHNMMCFCISIKTYIIKNVEFIYLINSVAVIKNGCVLLKKQYVNQIFSFDIRSSPKFLNEI